MIEKSEYNVKRLRQLAPKKKQRSAT